MNKPLTVGELRKLLESYPQDLPISIEHDWEFYSIYAPDQVSVCEPYDGKQVAISTQG